MRSATSVFYFVILQILWVFRSLYEIIMPEKNIPNVSYENLIQNGRVHHQPVENERRHLIQLYTTTPKNGSGRPVCYMNVCEMLTPHEEEMLRCVCSKGASDITYNKEDILPPTCGISRATFTNAWMESFSLVM